MGHQTTLTEHQRTTTASTPNANSTPTEKTSPQATQQNHWFEEIATNLRKSRYSLQLSVILRILQKEEVPIPPRP